MIWISAIILHVASFMSVLTSSIQVIQYMFPNISLESSISDCELDVTLSSCTFPMLGHGSHSTVLCILNSTLAMLNPEDLLFEVQPGNIFITDLLGVYYMEQIAK